MIFCLVNCLAQEYPMNETNTNEGGYEASELRKKLNGKILDRFPSDLKALMVPFDNGDFLRIPTEKEIHGENYYGEYESPYATQWKPMKLCRRHRPCGLLRRFFLSWRSPRFQNQKSLICTLLWGAVGAEYEASE